MSTSLEEQGPRFYGRRKGKPLRKQAREVLDSLGPRLSIPRPAAGQGVDPFSLFDPRPQAVWLEVGFGGGEHLAANAQANPSVGLIGCEVFLNGVASLLKHVQERGLDNVRLYAEDARTLLPAFPDACLDRAFVLFPDPWPKKRHAERRFVNPDNLDLLGRLLKDGAELRVASDDPTYIEWAREQLSAHPLFRLDPSEARWADMPGTRYEAKAIAAGRQPAYFRAVRIGR